MTFRDTSDGLSQDWVKRDRLYPEIKVEKNSQRYVASERNDSSNYSNNLSRVLRDNYFGVLKLCAPCHQGLYYQQELTA